MKTYCISDIHGHLKNLKAFVQTLSNDDRVFVLGDVVDKGPSAIECLLFIMKDKRFNLILGNHDQMMYRYLTATNPIEKIFYEQNWIDYNSGLKTYNEFLELNAKKRKEIIDYLSNLPIAKKITVNKKKYFLCHADPFANSRLKTNSDNKLVEDSVWVRLETYTESPYEDRTVILGHTPVQFFIEECRPFFNANTIKSAKVINIDGGLAGERELGGKLIAFCLNDMSYKIY